MRTRITRWSLIALLLVLACGSASYAALTEKYVLDGINDTVAVLRYHHRFATDAQYNLDLCRAAKALTEKQLTAEKPCSVKRRPRDRRKKPTSFSTA